MHLLNKSVLSPGIFQIFNSVSMCLH